MSHLDLNFERQDKTRRTFLRGRSMENSVKLTNVIYINTETPSTLQHIGVGLKNSGAEVASKKGMDDNNTAQEKRRMENGIKNVQRRNTVELERAENTINHVSVKISDDATTQRTEEILRHGLTNHGFSSEYSTSEKVAAASVYLELTPKATTGLPNSLNSESHPPPEKSVSDSSSLQSGLISRVLGSITDQWRRHQTQLQRLALIAAAALYVAYFAYAMYFRFGDDGSIQLVAMTTVAMVGILVTVAKKRWGKKLKKRLRGCRERINRHGSVINWIVVIVILLAVIVFVIVDAVVVSKSPYNLVSATGILVYVFLFFVFSKHPSHVNWQTICWGFALQFTFALCIIKTDVGYKVFEWLGNRVTDFFMFSDAGSKFVFGETGYLDHFFVFKVMPTVVFFSTVVSVLYHLGVMQCVISKVAWVMQITMGTTAGESLTTAANIFIGQSEAPLLIGPLLPDMTSSELHAVMTGGFATITGGIMAAYILLGVPANHLISASVMSAPAALAMSKLIYPETEESKTTVRHLKTALQIRSNHNVIGALSSGASASVAIVATVVVNLIAFIATLHFLNSVLTWFGERVGVEELTFQLVCSYVLWPFAFLMGVEFVDCRKVAQLIGIKTILNEFIAYTELGVFINNRKLYDAHVRHNGSWYTSGDAIYLVNETMGGNGTQLAGGILSDRSIAITTYALCGFSNIGSMGIVLGGLLSMAPSRKTELSSGVVTAMISGTVACFITACIAGLLYIPPAQLP